MDPDATLDELLALTGDPDAQIASPVTARIAELVHSLDGWLMTGGFLPRRWAPGWSVGRSHRS